MKYMIKQTHYIDVVQGKPKKWKDHQEKALGPETLIHKFSITINMLNPKL